MILSILIPTTPGREQLLSRLMAVLSPQIEAHPGMVEVLFELAKPEWEGGPTTGEKRNKLESRARGVYRVSIDDDDMVPEYYVAEIINAAKQDPDVITFRGFMTTNGEKRVDFFLRLGEKYEARIVDGVEKYFRFPNHIVPMKRELVKDFRFPEKTKGEDYPWALEIHTAGVLKSEVYIDRDMYHYDWISNKP